MPRFALSLHSAGPFSTHPTHFDLFLENGPELLSWRLSHPIHVHPYTSPATPTHPHHLKYLDFDGPLSGGRGHVSRLLHGTLLSLAITPHAYEALLLANNRPLKLSIQLLTPPPIDSPRQAECIPPTQDMPHTKDIPQASDNLHASGPPQEWIATLIDHEASIKPTSPRNSPRP